MKAMTSGEYNASKRTRVVIPWNLGKPELVVSEICGCDARVE